MAFEAKIIKDSICEGKRLTTMQVTMPRIILAEWNTHSAFARNTSSSRAIPFSKMVKQVIDSPFIPTYWGVNQSGMQAFTELIGVKRDTAIQKWLEARDAAVRIATELAAEKCIYCKGTGEGQGWSPISSCTYCEDSNGLGLNLHKQIPNRLLEPWMWTTNCTTGDADAWSNFFALRCQEDAEPHMQRVAYMAQRAYFESTPEELKPGQWHTPYIRPEEIEEIGVWLARKTTYDLETVYTDEAIPNLLNFTGMVNLALVQISTGRCARTSYLTQEGTRDFAEDIKLHARLRYHVPLHASPFEHVCQATGDGVRYAKYTGWKAYRHMLPREYVTDFKPNWQDYKFE